MLDFVLSHPQWKYLETEPEKISFFCDRLQVSSFSWLQTKQIADQVHKLDVDHTRKERYATVFLLAAATGLRCGELFALKWNDIDFKGGTIRADESADQRTYIVGPYKNAAAYRTILLADSEGREVLGILRRFPQRRSYCMNSCIRF